VGIGGHMNDSEFKLLTNVLRNMENEDLMHSDLEIVVNNIIKKFDVNLTPEQKNALLKEFLNYERIKKERKEIVEKFSEMEEEKHKAALYSFFNGDAIDL
jgi:uncharacterized protein YpuA (DUF1002 family)